MLRDWHRSSIIYAGMEKALTKIKFEDLDSREETSASDLEGYGSEEEEERQTRQLVVQQNRKGKKSGGFQSMGKLFLSSINYDKCVCMLQVWLYTVLLSVLPEKVWHEWFHIWF